MSKRFRLLIVVLVLALGALFLKPSYDWYYNTSSETKELATSSREQIRDYAFKKAAEDVKEITALAEQDDSALLPEKYAFLEANAKEYYKSIDQKLPNPLTLKDVLAVFKSADRTRAEGKLRNALEEHYREETISLKETSQDILQLGLDLYGGMQITLQADKDSLGDGQTMTEAIDEAMQILNNRIDEFGLTEPQIRKQGSDQIYVAIPGAADQETVDRFLKGKGSLAFHIVDTELSAKANEYLTMYPEEVQMALSTGKVSDSSITPAGKVIRGFYKKDSYGIDKLVDFRVIQEEIGLSGEEIFDVRIIGDSITGQPVVTFQLTPDGSDVFLNLTRENIGNTLAVVLANKIKAGATIQEEISNAVSMRGFAYEDADALQLVLKTAAMPVDLSIQNQQAVGASLGEDSIDAGLKAIGIGLAAVIIFMLFWYHGAGFIADIALVLNLVLVIAVLSALNFTLTLTSIAGLILTVGMAVDANVIIFERIREEYRLGKSAEASVKAGFKKAFWTVVDANITTFIAALTLSALGTGPIQGFAYTLAVGIISSMFTALFVSRLVFDFGIETLKLKKLSIGWRVK